MTEFSFNIKFPRFNSPVQKVIFHIGINLIYGESGVGKTNFCLQLAGLTKSSDITNFQISNFLPNNNSILVMQDPDDQIVAPTLYRELAFNYENLGIPTGDIQKGIKECIEKYNFYHNLNRHPSTLSGGEKQILNIITALSLYPEVIIIDDGMAFLSEKNRRKIISILKNYVKNTNSVIIWTTTSISDVKYSDDVWELRLDMLINHNHFEPDSLSSWKHRPGSIVFQSDKLSFSYIDNHPVFNHVNISVGPFRVLGLIGNNGTGKSTLAFLIAGILKPDMGIVSLTSSYKKDMKLGLLPQFPERILGGRTFEEIVSELSINNLINPSNFLKLNQSLKTFQIIWELIGNRPIHTLKISIIRLVMIQILCWSNYDVIILDEPLFSLGYRQKQKIIEFLKQVTKKKHLIIATHDISLSDQLCDCVLEIKNGSILPLKKMANSNVKSG